MRKPWRLASAGISAAALAASLVMISAQAGLAMQPASSAVAIASTGLHIHETFGSYYVGAPSIDSDAPVVEAVNGRTFNFVPANGGEELQFTADTSRCVAAADNGQDVVVHNCNNGSGNGVIWVEQQGPSTTLFVSQKFPGLYLSGDNHGHQFQIKPRHANGWEQQFTVGA